MELDTHTFKTTLEKELAVLEKELASVGQRNPNNPDDWEATQGDAVSGGADRNESADALAQYEEHTEILHELEIRFNNVKRALAKIENGKYGTCEINGGDIDLDRLEANPAARTCKIHINEERPNV